MPAVVEKPPVPSAARAAASVLREEILLKRSDGEWLGSEDDVLARLGVSRPTLRQAARLLEAEQLLVVKRGLKGGLFARRPTADGVAHIASVFLRAQGTSLSDLVRTYLTISEELARLAASNPDPAERARLVELLDERDPLGGPEPDRRALVRLRGEFAALLADVTGSPTLSLFAKVLWEIGRTQTEPQFMLDPAELEGTRRRWRALAEAVKAGNVQRAVRLQRESNARTWAWVEEHLADQRIR